MYRSRLARIGNFALIVSVIGFGLGCKNSPPADRGPRIEQPISVAAQQPAQQRHATPAAKLPPATAADVEAALKRIFGDDLVRKEDGPRSFIVGDFNGDDSEDLAVMVTASPEKLQDINSEVANWTIQDATQAFLPPPGKTVVAPPKIAAQKVEPGEELLAIIHGYGGDGWRGAQARQAYLLKHVEAKLIGTVPSQKEKVIRDLHLPVRSDAIKVVRHNSNGLLFWTGGVYAWRSRQG